MTNEKNLANLHKIFTTTSHASLLPFTPPPHSPTHMSNMREPNTNTHANAGSAYQPTKPALGENPHAKVWWVEKSTQFRGKHQNIHTQRRFLFMVQAWKADLGQLFRNTRNFILSVVAILDDFFEVLYFFKYFSLTQFSLIFCSSLRFSITIARRSHAHF